MHYHPNIPQAKMWDHYPTLLEAEEVKIFRCDCPKVEFEIWYEKWRREHPEPPKLPTLWEGIKRFFGV
jgi:hypothetical protein